MSSITTEEINTLAIEAVSGEDSAIHVDRESDVRGYYLHREEVECLTQLPVIARLVHSICESHESKGRCKSLMSIYMLNT